MTETAPGKFKDNTSVLLRWLGSSLVGGMTVAVALMGFGDRLYVTKTELLKHVEDNQASTENIAKVIGENRVLLERIRTNQENVMKQLDAIQSRLK